MAFAMTNSGTMIGVTLIKVRHLLDSDCRVTIMPGEAQVDATALHA